MAFGRLGTVGAGFGHLGASPGSGVAAPAVGGGALLVGEADGFATDFTYATDASRVALKSSGSTLAYAVDAFYQQAGTSPKMVYDAAGTLGWSPHNLIEQSKDASSVSQSAGVTFTVNTTAGPLGDMTADTCAISANSYFYKLASTGAVVGVTFCASVWLKAAAPTQIGFRLMCAGAAGGDVYALFSVTTSWQQFSKTITPTSAGTFEWGADVRAFTGDDGLAKTVIAADWQINRGTVPTAYLPTTTAARVGLALDYDPVTHVAKGLWSEPQATNLIIQSAAPATQGVTVTAVAHTLSIFGTGTLTLTGASTAGPLVGTGASNRVSLTFTPTAGTLTLTKSGTVTNAQLETGSVATSVIPTLAATVTRAADQVSVTPASINYSATAGSWWVEILQLAALAGTPRIIGTAGAASPLYYTSATTPGLLDTTSLTKTTTTIVGTTHKIACAFASGDRAFTADGLAAATDAGATAGLLAPTTLYFGNGASAPMHGYIRKIRYVPRRKSNAELTAETV